MVDKLFEYTTVSGNTFLGKTDVSPELAIKFFNEKEEDKIVDFKEIKVNPLPLDKDVQYIFKFHFKNRTE